MPISMPTPDPSAMAEALNLTRAGRLAEATAAIQRALSGVHSSAAEEPAPTRQNPDTTVVIEGQVVTDEREDAAARTRHRPRTHRTAPNCRAHSGRVHGAPPRATSPTAAGGAPSALFDLSSLPGLGSRAGANISRPYRLHVPAHLPPGPRPLVMLLHGGTQDGTAFAHATGFDALADVHGFIALYPEQIAAANPMRYWNWFNRSDQQRGAGEPSILVSLVDEVAARHSIDRDRVYVAGFSAGAAMSSVLGATYPDVFAGIGVHSGLAHGAAGDMLSAFSAMGRAPSVAAADPVPVIVIHGDSDPTVHVSNAGSVLEQFAPSGATRRTVTERVNGRDVERTVLEAQGHAVAERIVISGAGHAWSGGRPGGSYADPSGPDAAAEMVRFFGLAPGGAGGR